MRKLLSAVLLLALLTVSFGAVSCRKRPDSSETTATDNGTLPQPTAGADPFRHRLWRNPCTSRMKR